MNQETPSREARDLRLSGRREVNSSGALEGHTGEEAAVSATGGKCPAGWQLHHDYDRFKKYLTCDLAPMHRGLDHHDPAFGIWWSRCGLPEHGHPGSEEKPGD